VRNETLAIHGGYDGDPATKAVAVPIYQTAAYEFDSAEHGAALMTEFPYPEATELAAPWRDAAVRLYSNWLGYLARNRTRRLGTIGPKAPVHPAADLTYAGP